MHNLKGRVLQSHKKTADTHRIHITAACVHARTPAVPTSPVDLHGCIQPLQSVNNFKGACLLTHRVRGRLLHSRICASIQGDSSPGPQFSSFPSPYTPFSAELLLAVARLGHLERYRQEVAQLYEPDGAADLTRCGLLITNIFSPQLDHRPYYEKLEEYIDRATLAALATFDDAEALWDTVLAVPESSSSSSSTHAAASQGVHGEAILPGSTASTASGSSQSSPKSHMHLEGFSGLDMMQPDHLLRAIAAINQVLFLEEGLMLNTADPYDPLNGSIADVIDTKQGNQYSLTMVYLHVAEGLGLPCTLVGSPERILLRIGLPTSSSSTSTGSVTANFTGAACFLVDVAHGGQVYAWPGRIHSSSSRSSHCHASSPSTPSAAGSAAATAAASLHMDVASADNISDEWQKAVHTWLQLGADAHQDEDTCTGLKMDANHAIDQGSVLSDAADSDSSDIYSSLTNWQQAAGYSAVDAATRNSWKALYGPGALTEWGGLVSSSSSIDNGHLQYMQSGISDDGNDNIRDSNELRRAAAAADNTWFGGVDSTFAAAAVSPLPGSTEYGGDVAAGQCSSSSSIAGSSSSISDNIGSNTVTDSMDTFCGSDTEDSRQLNQAAPCTVANSASTGSSGGHLVPTVACLSEQDVQVKYGGLAPVRARVLLQQLLAGMKLSLLMSGREEEALPVIRYLRATDPFSLPDLRDEALALANAADYSSAAQLLREYLAVAPGAADADMVGEVLQQVQLAAEVAKAQARKQRWD